MNRLVVSLVLMLAVVALPQSARAVNYDYVALTATPAAQQGSVVASGITWTCRDRTCTVSGPWPTPGEKACRALAEKVGRITSYGHKEAKLSSAQLARCNEGAALRPVDGGLTPGPIRGGGTGSVEVPDDQTVIFDGPVDRSALLRTRENWRCRDISGGVRCTSIQPPLYDTRELVLECAKLVRDFRRVTYFSDSRFVLDAGQLARCNSPQVVEIEYEICSGADDLRERSTVGASMAIRGKRWTTDTTRYTELFDRIPANECRRTRVPGASWPVSEAQAIALEFKTGRTNIYDTRDNWDMARLVVTATIVDNQGRRSMHRLVDRRGTPLFRFKTKGVWTTEVIPWTLN